MYAREHRDQVMDTGVLVGHSRPKGKRESEKGKRDSACSGVGPKYRHENCPVQLCRYAGSALGAYNRDLCGMHMQALQQRLHRMLLHKRFPWGGGDGRREFCGDHLLLLRVEDLKQDGIGPKTQSISRGSQRNMSPSPMHNEHGEFGPRSGL